MSPHHKDDFFIAEYTLGLLEPDDVAQAHALLGSDDDAVVCALQWEARLLELTDGLTPLHPPANLLDRIHATLGLPRAAAAQAVARPAPQPAPASPGLKESSATPSGGLQPPAPPEALSATRPQSGTASDFEPRLLRPDTGSAPARSAEASTYTGRNNGAASGTHALQRSATANIQANTHEVQAPEQTGRGGRSKSPRAMSTRAEPSLAGSAAQPAQAAAATQTDHASQPLAAQPQAAQPKTPPPQPPASAPQSQAPASQRVRTAPTDPTEAFRREAASRRPARHGFWRSLWFWRALSTALGALAIVLVLPENTFKHDPALSAALQPPAPIAPTVVQVAVLQAPGTSSTPGWILTVDSRQNVVLTPQVDIFVPESEAVYLWTYTEQSPRPRLLGAIDPARPLTLPVDVTGQIAPGQIFEMTQEPRLAAPQEPDGPILFIGRTVSLS